jgi:chemotaxis protein MotA
MSASLSNFADIPSVLIVVGGTMASALNSYNMKSLFAALKVMIRVLFGHKINYLETMQEMLKIATVARKEGPLALEKYTTEDPFLRKGLMLVADGTKGESLRSILELERDAKIERHEEGQSIIQKLSELAPAWGMIGTLIGLVIMLLNLKDPDSIGPSMAIALLTTFYGAILANFIFIPAATKLDQRTKSEVLNTNLMIETLASIAESENPRLLQEKLLGYLPPKERITAAPGKG